mgnify:CR=1 FL=1
MKCEMSFEALWKNIHNMPQGPPNLEFMQEKLQKGDFTMWDLCTIDWPKEDAANFESQNFEGP